MVKPGAETESDFTATGRGDKHRGNIIPNVETRSIDKEKLTKSFVENHLCDMQGTEDRPNERAFRHHKNEVYSIQKEKKCNEKMEAKTEEKKKSCLEAFSMNLILTRGVSRNHDNPGKTG